MGGSSKTSSADMRDNNLRRRRRSKHHGFCFKKPCGFCSNFKTTFFFLFCFVFFHRCTKWLNTCVSRPTTLDCTGPIVTLDHTHYVGIKQILLHPPSQQNRCEMNNGSLSNFHFIHPPPPPTTPKFIYIHENMDNQNH